MDFVFLMLGGSVASTKKLRLISSILTGCPMISDLCHNKFWWMRNCHSTKYEWNLDFKLAVINSTDTITHHAYSPSPLSLFKTFFPFLIHAYSPTYHSFSIQDLCLPLFFCKDIFHPTTRLLSSFFLVRKLVLWRPPVILHIIQQQLYRLSCVDCHIA